MSENDTSEHFLSSSLTHFWLLSINEIIFTNNGGLSKIYSWENNLLSSSHFSSTELDVGFTLVNKMDRLLLEGTFYSSRTYRCKIKSQQAQSMKGARKEAHVGVDRRKGGEANWNDHGRLA